MRPGQNKSDVFYNNGRTISQKLGGAGHNIRSRETHADNGVGAHFDRFGNHAVDRLLAGFGQHFGIVGDFAADDIAQLGHDVVPDMQRPNRIAPHHPQGFDYFLAGDVIGRTNYHLFTSWYLSRL